MKHIRGLTRTEEQCQGPAPAQENKFDSLVALAEVFTGLSAIIQAGIDLSIKWDG